MTFNPDYIRLVLNENFEDAKALLLAPLMAIHYAHLVMLADTGIVSRDAARALRDALAALDREAIRRDALRWPRRGPVLPRRSAARRRRAPSRSPDGSTPRAAATTST